MLLNYNPQELTNAVNDFYYATGINIVLVDAEFNALTQNALPDNFCNCLQSSKEGKKRCVCSDLALIKQCEKTRGIERHICHAGLIDTAVPLIGNDEILGYIIIGQMRSDTDFDDIYKLISDLDIDREVLKEKYEKLPYCDTKKSKSLATIAVMLTEYILFKNLLKPKYDILFESAANYIRENLDRELSTQEICDKTGTTKNVLYKVFRKNLNCTVGEFVNAERINKAKDLLLNSKLSTQEIAEKVGFGNYTYFCKLFKKQTGITPFKFKTGLSH